MEMLRRFSDYLLGIAECDRKRRRRHAVPRSRTRARSPWDYRAARTLRRGLRRTAAALQMLPAKGSGPNSDGETHTSWIFAYGSLMCCLALRLGRRAARLVAAPQLPALFAFHPLRAPPGLVLGWMRGCGRHRFSLPRQRRWSAYSA